MSVSISQRSSTLFFCRGLVLAGLGLLLSGAHPPVVIASDGRVAQEERGPNATSVRESIPEPRDTRVVFGVDDEDDVVVYEREFYDRYNPVTALDLVERTPGFSVSRGGRGGNNRGFAETGSNVLIDGERPSSKSDSVRDILSRIPAGQVERVELIRGSTGGLDVSGQSVVANVVLEQQMGTGFAEVGAGLEAGEAAVRGELSWDSELGPVDYLVSASRFKGHRREVGTEELTRPDGADERREEIDRGEFESLSTNLRTETRLSDRDVLRLSGQFRSNPGSGDEISTRFEAGATDPDVVHRLSERGSKSYEIGGDYERTLSDAARLKVIGLLRRENRDGESSLEFEPASGESDRRASISDSTDGESIARAELDWSVGSHTVQANGELAHNFVESDFRLFRTIEGELQEVELAGGDTRVSELRSEWSLTDSWRMTPRWTVDTGLALEVSTISQTGDIDNERSFRFLKPTLAVTYAPSRDEQFRLRGQREVAQLDFFDFVSSADFEDEDLEFGNPELEPERTWALSATYERRFGEVGVVELRLFYDAIQQVQDLLPLGDTFEIAGNIGDGRRIGVDLDATIGLGGIGLEYGQLELGALVQSTSVTDPVTGRERSLSGERDFRGRIGYRQEAPDLRLSWGASYREGSSRTFFGLDELDLRNDAGELEAFVEKVVLDGMKIRFSAENLLDQVSLRDRTVFDGARTFGITRFRELRRRVEGREFSLTVSRAF